MQQKLNKLKKLILSAFFLLMSFSMPLWSVSAKCPDNVIPDPLDPDCTRNITVGGLIGNVVAFVPVMVTLIAIGVMIWGAIKIILAEDADKRNEGIEVIKNAFIGLVAFGLIGLILFIITLLTGFDFLKAIGL